MTTKLAIYVVNYKKHPTYKQFYKLYGDPQENVKAITDELMDKENVIKIKNTYRTPNWVIVKHLFKTRFSMADKSTKL